MKGMSVRILIRWNLFVKGIPDDMYDIYIIPKGFVTDELIFLVPKTSENYFVYAGSYLIPYDYANVKYIKAIENEEMVKK